MKVAHGTGKATLPGELQVWRFSDHDLVSLAAEPNPGQGGKPLLSPVWRGDGPARETSARDDLAAARDRCRDELAELPAELRTLENKAIGRKLVASDALVREIERLVGEAR
jgi:hypothetical protein